MPEAETQRFKVGDRVFVDAIDGFCGPATVVELREDSTHNKYKVQMEERNPFPPFWAHDFELSPAPTPDPDAPYDSRQDTLAHIGTVRWLLGKVIGDLHRRQMEHDRSKLEVPEKPVFDEFTPKLRDTTYGSEEYKGFLAAMKPALDHHYASNRGHHPEGNPDGIRGMSLVDILEMLCDWKAATLRHADGDIRRSIEINQERFGYGDALKAILLNTLPLLEAED